MTETAIGFKSGGPATGATVTDIAKARQSSKRFSGKVMEDRPIWEQYQRVGGTLTPVMLSNIIREADAGRIRALMDLGNEARQKDGHLSAVLSQSEESIAGLEWELILPKKAKKKDRNALDMVEQWLRNDIAEPFTALISSLAGGPYQGFCVNEAYWAKFKKGLLLPFDFEQKEHRRFEYRDKDGRLVWRDADMPVGVDFRAEFPNRFVVATPRITGDIPAREGLIRVLLWAALCRNWSLTDWLRTGEIAWKPWRIAKYQKGATEEDIDGLVEILERLASTGSAALPETTTLDVKWPGGSGGGKPTHAELFNILAQEMSKAALGQTETTQSSTSSGYAQGKVHYAVRENILAARARHVSAVITRDVIRAIIQLNYGDSVLIPRFRLITKAPTDLKAFGDGIKVLAKDSGVKIGAKWVRSTAGIPEPEAGEETIGGTPEPEPNPNEPKDGEDGKEGEGGEEGDDKEPKPTGEDPDDNDGPAGEDGDD